MLKVLEFAFVGYPATDIARARAFYEGVLNLAPATTFEHEGKQWIEYEIGPHVLAVSNMAGDLWKPSSDGPGLALEVENFDEAIDHLRSHDVKFVVEPMNTPTCRMALISDPDGNTLTIHKRNSA